MGFTKLDEGILQSSIIGESGEVFKVWIALLASCKEDGIAKLSPVFLASVCRLDINIVMDALKKLMSPDPFSRSKEEEGRRLKEVDGGYLLVNYLKYRERTYSGSKEAIRKRKQRQPSENDDAHPLFSEITRRFGIGYESVKKVKYMDYRKDGKILKQFLQDFPDIDIERFFENVEFCARDSFHTHNLSIRYICSNFSLLEAKRLNSKESND